MAALYKHQQREKRTSVWTHGVVSASVQPLGSLLANLVTTSQNAVFSLHCAVSQRPNQRGRQLDLIYVKADNKCGSLLLHIVFACVKREKELRFNLTCVSHL